MGFLNDVENLGLFCALECKMADLQYKTDVAIFEARSKRIAKDLPVEIDVVDEEKIHKSIHTLKKPWERKDNQEDDVVPFDEDVTVTIAPIENPPATIKKDVEDVDYSILLGAFNSDDVKNNLDDAYVELPELDNRKVKLTILDLLYLGCFIRAEEVYKNMNPDTSEEDMVFVNSLNFLLSGLPFNYSKDVMDIENLIDLKDLKKIIKYEKDYENLGYSQEICAAYETVKDICANNKKQTTTASAPEVTINDIVSPLKFATDPELAKKISEENKANAVTIKKSEITMLEKKFEGLLDNYQHQFNKIMDLYELTILHESGRFDSFLIDPGHVFGVGTSLLIDRYGSMMPLPVSLKDICKKILANRMAANTLNQKEMAVMTKNLMADYRIYTNIDMSRGEELIGKMTAEEYKKFQGILSTIVSLPWGKDGRPVLPRTRIRSFKSWNDFILVSDEKVKCPSLGNFNMLISEMTIIVKNDKILIRYDDNEGIVDLTKVA